jgi:NADH-quinone oxidoreductase subunit L
MVMVTTVSSLVHLYSIGSMAGDSGVQRYFAWLGLFTFSMLGIVVANNLLLLFVFWEWVGFASYILIGYWMARPEAAAASKKAFITNRLSDLFFIIGLMMIWTHTSSFGIANLSVAGGAWTTVATLCIFGAVIGKSAQFPLFTWLPDAMEGPISVSALIHAATMVAAGVFLLIRIEPLLSTPTLHVIAIVGAVTALLGALSALHQFDIKKILAYSTISQLGLMVFALGTGFASASLEHLFAHAFFKACLFLAAGSVFYAIQQAQRGSPTSLDPQDLRNLGGLRRKMPVTFWAFAIAGASLAGMPLTSGFISKDSILLGSYAWADTTWKWCLVLITFTVSFLTVIYTFRLIWFMFLSPAKNDSSKVEEAPAIMRFPPVLLAGASLWFVLSGNPFIPSRDWIVSLPAPPGSAFVSGASVILITLGLIVSWSRYRRKELPGSMQIFRHGFYFDFLYEKLFANTPVQVAATTNSIDNRVIDRFIHRMIYLQVSIAHLIGWFDKVIVDGLVNGVGTLSHGLGNLARSFQTGKVQLYIFWAVLGLLIFLFFTLGK